MLLCFGDSNTWGFTPQGGRYVAELRWPNRLASQLGVALNAQGQPGRTLIAERRELGLCSGLHAWQEGFRMAPPQMVLALGMIDLAAGPTPAGWAAWLV